MSEGRLQRTRETLPAGYQFGEGRCRHDYRAQGWFIPDIDAHFYTAVCRQCGHDCGLLEVGKIEPVRGFIAGRDLGDEA